MAQELFAVREAIDFCRDIGTEGGVVETNAQQVVLLLAEEIEALFSECFVVDDVKVRLDYLFSCIYRIILGMIKDED